MNEYIEKGKDLIFLHGLDIITAIVVLILGIWLIKFLVRQVNKVMIKRDVDASLRPFLVTLISTALKVLLVISVISMMGIATTGFVAVIGAAGLAIGLALSGTLQNFAGGVLILIIKPMKVGDYIETDNHSGTVKEIQIFHTILKTPDNQIIWLPNGPLSTGSLKNYSTEPTRRAVKIFGIGYDDDIDAAKSILFKIIEEDTRILKDPAPQVFVEELADSSVNFSVRFFATNEDYWHILFELPEKVKKAFDAGNISIPFPQRDIHINQIQNA